jgi:hypothetical protein
LWDADEVPWVPELFSAPVLERLLDKRRREELAAVPYFDGLLVGDMDALVESFAGEPVVYDPVRGRVRGVPAFTEFATRSRAWLTRHHVSVEAVAHVIPEGRGFEEVVLHLELDTGRVDLPVAVVADRRADGRIEELRIYASTVPLTGRHLNRAPLMQPDPRVGLSDVVAEHVRALAAGDVDAILATFAPDGYVREPQSPESLHRMANGLRPFYERLFARHGGISLEHCAVIDDGGTSALEYNVVRRGDSTVPPQAGVAVYVRGAAGRLVAVRAYDDADVGAPL